MEYLHSGFPMNINDYYLKVTAMSLFDVTEVLEVHVIPS